jgi:PAS domain S-box-containing protein
MLLLMPLIIFVAGMGLTFSLTSYLITNQRRQARIATLATSVERTNRELKNRINERDQIADSLRNNEREFRAIIDRVSDVIMETNAMGIMAYVNASWTYLSGFDIRDTLTKSLFDFVHESDRTGLQQYFNQALAGEDSLRKHEVRILRKTGGFRQVEVGLRSLRRAGQASARIVGTMTDISERRRQEAQLREAEQKYRAMVENSVAGIFQSTPDGRYISVNPAFAHIMGYSSPAELVASIRDILLKVAGAVKEKELGSYPVSRIMTSKPECLDKNDPLSYALHKMSIGKFRHVPVLDNGIPIGVVSTRDLIDYLTEK